MTAVALVPLKVWFAASIIAAADGDYASFLEWFGLPISTVCMVLLQIALFYHTALGLQVVIEDYVHSGAKAALLVAVRLGCFVLATAGILATGRIAIGS